MTTQQHLHRSFLLAAAILFAAALSAQENNSPYRNDEYGHTLNIGVGLTYFPYLYGAVPFITANYEFNVARSFTLAPFAGLASYRSNRFYDYLGTHYYYHETILPIGVKGTYYFDRLLHAGKDWDFYLAASAGFVYDRVVWDHGYAGGVTMGRGASPLYIDGHIGAEYHIGRRTGLFLDLSTGVSTLGIALHRL